MNTRQAHWQQVYSTKDTQQLSWFQQSAAQSLAYIMQSELDKSEAIIDIGGGASVLVDELLALDYSNVSVLDISSQALEVAKSRLAKQAERVDWLAIDLLNAEFNTGQFSIWHDRAVFHFLTSENDKASYRQQLNNALKVGGYAIIATFDIGGPTKCSGIDIVQYSWQTLADFVGDSFELVAHCNESHITPFDITQQFTYCLFRKVA
ncbi:class I SAM-dependent methyltransferase [Psychrobium sp. MM17-31]|uniref:class I SAM-dependent methyltransferase n=1 Tax=Psychrobium sp. MM17-31 TaxID=2917758 RepID=UPI001EF4A032|nr:class I SAM-dependent methyltransferase [Psychrobium sp. MM17-31]MCG7530842.1 class I SAM-dependent methyltransferase [Psychrobium sp. MM17-31]